MKETDKNFLKNKKLFRCKICGRRSDKPNSLCKGCEKRFELIGSTLTDVTNLKKSKIYDYKGLKICRVCGLSFKSLQIHLARFHHLKIGEYTKMFGIEQQTKHLKNKLHESETHKRLRIAKSRKADRQYRACQILKRHNPKIKGGEED